METKNIFISMPMSGKSDSEVWNEICECVAEWNTTHQDEKAFFVSNYEVTEDHIKDFPCKPGRENLLYLALALIRMATCDDVIFHKDWENARGCRVEKLVYDLYFKSARE